MFWDRVAKLYDYTQKINGKVYKKMILYTRLFTPEGAFVLDVASGTGELTFAAAANAKKVVCTDISIAMLEQAKKKAIKKDVKNIEFDVRDILNLKDADETYDVVMAGNVLHLLDNPEAAVRELYRVTKIGGKLLLPTFMIGSKKSLKLIELYKLFGFKPSTNYTPDTYGKMLISCKLGKVKMKFIKGIIPCCYAVIEKK